jgi:hypothetical protein
MRTARLNPKQRLALEVQALTEELANTKAERDALRQFALAFGVNVPLGELIEEYQKLAPWLQPHRKKTQRTFTDEFKKEMVRQACDVTNSVEDVINRNKLHASKLYEWAKEQGIRIGEVRAGRETVKTHYRTRQAQWRRLR